MIPLNTFSAILMLHSELGFAKKGQRPSILTPRIVIDCTSEGFVISEAMVAALIQSVFLPRFTNNSIRYLFSCKRFHVSTQGSRSGWTNPLINEQNVCVYLAASNALVLRLCIISYDYPEPVD